MRAEPALCGGRREDDVVTEWLAAASRLGGFFVARGEGVYGFLHRQFQEYFAAWHLVMQIAREGQAAFLRYPGDPNWREVLLLAVGILEAAAADMLDEEGLTAPTRAVTDLLDGLLAAPDPTGGLLPHNLLLTAAAIRELANPPPAMVGCVAAGLIEAYCRDDESRFAVLHKRVEESFAALPRRVDEEDKVGAALCTALMDSSAGEAGSWTRLAAAELILQHRWFTPATVRALAEAWQRHLEPASMLMVALQEVWEEQPDHFDGRFLRFRRTVEREPALWEAIEAHPHWQDVVRTLYLAPSADLTVAGIVRDSPLTGELLNVLRQAPADGERLHTLLWDRFHATDQDAIVRRDAGLALMYLGEQRIVPTLVAEVSIQGALLAAMFGARAHALARARARDLVRSLEETLRRLDAIAMERPAAIQEAPSADLRNLLNDGLSRARRLTTILMEGGVITVWMALIKAWEEQRPSLADWAAAPRPRLDLERLVELDAVRA